VSDHAVPPEVVDTAARFASSGPEHCVARRDDGVYADPEVLGTTLVAAIDGILHSGHYFKGLDYALLIKALYGHGPALPRDAAGRTVVRFADDIAAFTPARQALYRSVKIADGHAEYYFEPVFMADGEGVDQPARLDTDEFVADIWTKGIRFGVEVDAIARLIDTGAAGRYIVARRLVPQQGEDARIEEVTADLHRSDAPRQLANGKLDLMSFENRFPQVKMGTRLLRKVPATRGLPGFDLNGIPVAPEPPRDVDLGAWSDEGTALEHTPDGEFLVACRDGFLNVDAKRSRIAITDKIVSRDGVSARTTGNLHLSGDYEEFGEIQEQRIIEGESITVHGNVFGHVLARSGAVNLRRNLVGGSARNLDGNVLVLGVASNASVVALKGEVVLARAENCVIAGARVRIETAVNCEIIGGDVEVTHAEGCAIAASRLAIDSAAPWRQHEMLAWILRPDCSRIDAALDELRARMDGLGALAARQRAAMEALTAQPDVRAYMLLASRVRKGELVLTPAQKPQFERLAAASAPALKELGRLSRHAQALEAEQQGGAAILLRLQAQRAARIGTVGVKIGLLAGEVQVRVLPFDPDLGCAWDVAPRELKGRLRDTRGTELLHAGAGGSWSCDSAGMPDSPAFSCVSPDPRLTRGPQGPLGDS